jgi:hypothetical protein
LGRRIVGDNPRVCGSRAGDRFKNTRRACDQVAAPRSRARGTAIIAAGNAAVKKVVRQNERLSIARPAAGPTTPARSRRSAI